MKTSKFTGAQIAFVLSRPTRERLSRDLPHRRVRFECQCIVGRWTSDRSLGFEANVGMKTSGAGGL